MVKLTNTCRQSIYTLGGSDQDILDTIISLDRSQFYKSMTSYADHRIWQDVYHVIWNDITIYLKFQIYEDDYLVLSFKEKQQ